MKKMLFLLLTIGSLATANAQNPCNISVTQTPAPLANYPYRVLFEDNSVPPATPTWYAESKLYYGDGSPFSYFYNDIYHHYPGPGTYTASVVKTVYDSLNSNAIICIDSTTYQVNVSSNPAGINSITGTIHWNQNLLPDSVAYFKVWLIQHDATANTLTAVTSVNVYPWAGSYAFNNISSGDYLVKAAPSYGNGPVPAYGFVPTYHDSSLYWSNAVNINHTGGSTVGKDIWMQLGTPTTGPGFVDGNISSGAGKGTGTGVPDMLVFLRNNIDNKMIAATYTDANGNYTFGNIPNGSYNVYPEEMSYATTPSPVFSIASGQTSNTGVDFVQTDAEIIPMGTLSVAVLGKNEGIRIYPNPVHDQLVIENKNGLFNDVIVYSTLGQVIKQQSMKPGISKMELSSLSNGTYYVIVSGLNGARSIRITKK